MDGWMDGWMGGRTDRQIEPLPKYRVHRVGIN